MNKQYLIWMLKGAAMGAADALPGVSGGTIALITGIYERFIAALASIKLSLWSDFKQNGLKGVWQKIDGTFLLCLGSGILISLFSVLSLVNYLFAIARPAVWSFFLGVIIVSLWQLARGRNWQAIDIALMALGLVITAGISFLSGVSVEPTPLALVLGGMLAITAMLLPGISGSFMLLLLGLYPVITEAVHQRDLIVVAWVALGCFLGVVSFSRVLQWLLKRWHDWVMSFMLGFVAGALIKVWPWQAEAATGYSQWFLPHQYAASTGEPIWLWTSIVMMLIGGAVVVLLHKHNAD